VTEKAVGYVRSRYQNTERKLMNLLKMTLAVFLSFLLILVGNVLADDGGTEYEDSPLNFVYK
jgi:hypothetical protein